MAAMATRRACHGAPARSPPFRVRTWPLPRIPVPFAAPGLVGAYTYSDMTGFALANAGTPSG